MTNYTLEDLMVFTQMENELMEGLFGHNIEDHREPPEEIVNNLLAYSKALSIRKSRSMNSIRLVLN